ncbi:MAG: hypothetical protein K6A35_08245 [bacterium]|jgi:hypothetical protein|nr:hypothetical protein [bacterium]
MSSDSAIEAYKKFIECCQKDDSHGWLFICEDSVVKLLSLTALKFAAETGNTIVKERMGDLSEAELVKLQSSMAKLGAESLCSKVKDIDSNESKALWSWCSKILLKIFKLEDPVVSVDNEKVKILTERNHSEKARVVVMLHGNDSWKVHCL